MKGLLAYISTCRYSPKSYVYRMLNYFDHFAILYFYLAYFANLTYIAFIVSWDHSGIHKQHCT